jgi:alpha-N-arabinofuranosidase
MRAPASQWWATSKTAKALYLEPRADRVSGRGNPSFLAVRQQNNDFSSSVTLTAQPQTTNCIAGFIAYQNEGHYYAINVKIEAGHLTEIMLATQRLPDNLTSLDLKIEGAGPVMKCSYRSGNGDYTQLGQDLQSSFLSTDVAGGFQGVMLGMFAHN